MIIIKNTIYDISELDSHFFNFSRRVSTNTNYTARFDIRIFQYEPTIISKGNHSPFELTHLQEICYDQSAYIQGIVETATFNECTEFINLCLSCGGGAGSPGEWTELDLRRATSKECAGRIAWFWNEVNKYMTLPPSRTYSHTPSEGSYFDDGIFWQFCFILLNNTETKGIVLSGYCSD